MQGAGSGVHSPVVLNLVKIWMAKIFASLATPFGGSPACWSVFKPAAMPATWVPCRQRFELPLRQLKVSALAEPGPVCDCVVLGHRLNRLAAGKALEKHASATTLPKRNSWSDLTPVSSTATAWPAPVA